MKFFNLASSDNTYSSLMSFCSLQCKVAELALQQTSVFLLVPREELTMRSLSWDYNLLICILYDIFDFTVGHALLALLFSSAIAGRGFADTCLVQIAFYER
jgi:hypothetical protein